MEKRFSVPVDLGDSPEHLWVEVILTHEGIIVDVYRYDNDDMADCMATGGRTWNELGLMQWAEGEPEVQTLIDAAKVADEFFQQNDDFTEMGEFPVPEFIQDLRKSIAEVTN